MPMYLDIDNSSGRSAIYRLPTRKLLAVDRIFLSMISCHWYLW